MSSSFSMGSGNSSIGVTLDDNYLDANYRELLVALDVGENNESLVLLKKGLLRKVIELKAVNVALEEKLFENDLKLNKINVVSDADSYFNHISAYDAQPIEPGVFLARNFIKVMIPLLS